MTALSNFYSHIGNRFAVAGAYYGARGHRGQDFTNPAGTAVPCAEAGTVVATKRSSFIGQTVVVKLHDGKYAGYAHLASGHYARVGSVVHVGDTIGYVASATDSPGSAWTGPHSHQTLGATSDAIFWGVVYDPLARILASIKTPAPPALRHYTVKSGDSLSRIGSMYRKSWLSIYRANRRTIGLNPNRIYAGMVLVIPS